MIHYCLIVVLYFSVRTEDQCACSEHPCYCGKVNHVTLHGENFTFYDSVTSSSVYGQIYGFSHDEYKLKNVIFESGDVVVDIGANVGVFAIPLARKFPFLKIYSYEPVPELYEYFRRNIKINNISEGTITPVNKGVTGDGREIKMILDPQSWGSYMSDLHKRSKFTLVDEQIKSLTVADIFKENNIKVCRLFKIDCEGCEYEALLNTSDEIFSTIEIFRGEFHRLNNLVSRGYGYSPYELYDVVKGKGVKDLEITFWGVQNTTAAKVQARKSKIEYDRSSTRSQSKTPTQLHTQDI